MRTTRFASGRAYACICPYPPLFLASILVNGDRSPESPVSSSSVSLGAERVVLVGSFRTDLHPPASREWEEVMSRGAAGSIR
jgi:hypothetical protein